MAQIAKTIFRNPEVLGAAESCSDGFCERKNGAQTSEGRISAKMAGFSSLALNEPWAQTGGCRGWASQRSEICRKWQKPVKISSVGTLRASGMPKKLP